MFPTSTIEPEYESLDPKVVPLVKTINGLGLLTYYSCEGHRNGSFIQSRYPFVVITPGSDTESAHRWLRFMGMLGIYNTNCEHDAVPWKIVPSGNTSLAFHLEPLDTHRPLREMHKGIAALSRSLKRMDKWYRL